MLLPFIQEFFPDPSGVRMRRCYLALCLLGCFSISSFAQPSHIPVRVVIVTMWQRGNGATNTPVQFHLWIKREHLTHVYPLPGGDVPVRMNPHGVLGILTGVGTAKATASIMALGLDPRFNLTHAYWLIDGVAGGDPADTSFGPAVWVRRSSTARWRMKSTPARFHATGPPASCRSASHSLTSSPR